MPVLENFGLKVIEEYPFDLDDGRLGRINDFICEVPDAGILADFPAFAARLESALTDVLLGTRENDGFANRRMYSPRVQ